MTADPNLTTYPPHYPHDGTYADLLCWHMDYWGTRPGGSTATNGKLWSKKEIRQAAFGGSWEKDGPRVGIGNWRGNGSAPDESNSARIASALFGNNPLFDAWRSDLEQARKWSRDNKNNSQTAEFPDPPPIVSPTTSVPQPTNYFMGRNDEVEVLATLLASAEAPSAVLVQGGPGMGKTELTKAVTHHSSLAPRFAERRYFVPLETATTSEAMQDAVIRAIGGEPAHGFAAATQHLKANPALLVLDNLETPWEPIDQRRATEQTLADLATIPTVAIIASFRGNQTVGGPNWHYHLVDALPPATASDLFVTIAGPRIRDAPELSDFVAELGGIPLAIELVARRAHGRDGLRLLWREWLKLGAELAVDPDYEVGRLTSLPHSIELSLRSSRLSKSALRLFSLLGVLPAGLSAKDAEQIISGSVFRAIEQLCGVGIAVERADRIDLLPPIREHAHRKYPPDAKDSQAWVAHYLNAISLLGRVVGSASGADATQRLQWEFRNIEAALRTKLANRAEAAEAFHYFTRAARWSPIPTTLFDELIATCSAEGDLLGEGNYVKVVGDLAFDRSDYNAAQISYVRASELFRKSENRPERQANCVRMMGNVALYKADFRTAQSTFEQAILLYRQTDDRLGEANCIKGLASVALHCADYNGAEAAFEEAHALYQSVADDLGEANCVKGLADIALRRSNYERAESGFIEARELYRRIGDSLGTANCCKRLGDIALYQNRSDDARAAYDDALVLYKEIGNGLGEAECAAGFGDVALAQADLNAAQSALESAKAQFERIGSQLGLAQSIMRLGDVASERGNKEVARAQYAAAHAIFGKIGDKTGQQDCLDRLKTPS